MMSICVEVNKKLPSFDQISLSGTLWSCAFLGYDPGTDILTAIMAEATEQMPSFSAHNVARSLWACTKFGPMGQDPGDELLEALLQQTERKLRQLSPEDLDTCLHAYKVFLYKPGVALCSQAMHER